MKAWFWVKAVVLLVAVGLVFFIGFVAGGTSVSSEVDDVRMQQLESCVPIESTEALSQCTGIKFVGGQ